MEELFQDVSTWISVWDMNGPVEYVKGIIREKKGTCMGLCLLFFAMVMLFLGGIVLNVAYSQAEELTDDRHLNKQYIQYEQAILHQVYRYDEGTNRYYLETAPVDLILTPKFYRMGAQNYDYRLPKITSKNAEDYVRIANEVKQVYKNDTANREAAAEGEIARGWIDTLILGILMAGVSGGINCAYGKSLKKYEKAAEEGNYKCCVARLIGREHEASRSGSYYSFEVTVKGENYQYKVSPKVFNQYVAGKDVLLIRWNCDTGLYDEYDVYIPN